MSAYPLTTFAVSAILSPFEAEEEFASEKPRTLPPSSYIAASKLSLVLVEGSKKSVASFLPRHLSAYFAGFFLMSDAVAISESISSRERSRISIRLLIFVSPFCCIPKQAEFSSACFFV